ncbi:MAG: hypothetical protein V3T31_05375, partial [candidate division Zixibacteria bacterium]
MRFLTSRRCFILMTVISVYFGYSLAFGSTGAENGDGGGGHGGPVLQTLMELIVILLAAKLGGDLFERFKSPAVLGELVFGMLLGNLHLIGFDGLEV